MNPDLLALSPCSTERGTPGRTFCLSPTGPVRGDGDWGNRCPPEHPFRAPSQPEDAKEKGFPYTQPPLGKAALCISCLEPSETASKSGVYSNQLLDNKWWLEALSAAGTTSDRNALPGGVAVQLWEDWAPQGPLCGFLSHFTALWSRT